MDRCRLISNEVCNAAKTVSVEVLFNFRNDVNEDEWRFLLTGGIALDNIHRNPASEWLSNKSWAEIVRCSNMAAFNGLKEDFEKEVSTCLYRLSL